MDPMTATSHDLLIYGAPLVLALLASMFKLDELIGTSKSRKSSQLPQRYGSMRASMMSDPDGRPWHA